GVKLVVNLEVDAARFRPRLEVCVARAAPRALPEDVLDVHAEAGGGLPGRLLRGRRAGRALRVDVAPGDGAVRLGPADPRQRRILATVCGVEESLEFFPAEPPRLDVARLDAEQAGDVLLADEVAGVDHPQVVEVFSA